MNKWVGIAILTSFVMIAVFGFLAMGHTGCIMSIAAQSSCMQGRGSADSFASHFQIYRSFSLAVFGALLVAEILLIARSFKIAAASMGDDPFRICVRSFAKLRVAKVMSPRLLAWLSIHELRDPYAFLKAGA